jgi:type IV pilus assembly protein PilF
MKAWTGPLLLLPILVGGCVANPPAKESSIQEPISQQTAVGVPRQRAKAHVELGMEYFRSGGMSVALDEARLAIESDSSYPLGYNLLALVQMTLKENRGAEENFRRALELAPGDPEITNNFGWFLCQTEREQQSIPYFVTASNSALYQTPTKPLTNAGICSLAMKDDKAAEGFFARALRADPANIDAQFLLADICYRTGRLQEARARLNDVHRRVDPSAQSAWLGVRVERKLEDREAENRFAGEIRRRFRDSQEYQLLMQGKYE